MFYIVVLISFFGQMNSLEFDAFNETFFNRNDSFFTENKIQNTSSNSFNDSIVMDNCYDSLEKYIEESNLQLFISAIAISIFICLILITTILCKMTSKKKYYKCSSRSPIVKKNHETVEL